MIKKLLPVFLTAIMVISTITVLATPAKATSEKVTRFEITFGQSGPTQLFEAGNLQAAIDQASPGSTIAFNGVLTENVNVYKDGLIIKSMSGPANCYVRAANTAQPVFTVTANNVKIQGITIQNGAVSQSAGVYIKGVANCGVSGNIFTNNWFGVRLEGSSCAITYNSAHDNGFAILLNGANNNVIDHNVVSNNDYGIYGNNANGNTITNNIANNNRGGAFFPITEARGDGMFLQNSNGNTIQSNEMSFCDAIGITLWQSPNNKVFGNKMESNVWWGIRIADSSGNQLALNTFKSNGQFNINLVRSDNNIIALNNLINAPNNLAGTNSFSTPQKMAYVYNGVQFTNFLGNYWSGYTGIDANKDGIGDAPSYSDSYPLMTLAENYLKRPAPVSPISITKIQLVSGHPRYLGWTIANSGTADMWVAPYAAFYKQTATGYALDGAATGYYAYDGTSLTTAASYGGYGWVKVPAGKSIAVYSQAVVPLDAKWAVYNVLVYNNNKFEWRYPSSPYTQLR